MYFCRFFIGLILLVIIFSTLAWPQSIIINELFNSGGNDEWVELLVVQDGLDIRGWDLRDFTSGGTAQTPLSFTAHALWSDLKSGTIIVVARSENTFAEDLDPADYLLVVKSNNATLVSGSVFSLAGTSDAVQIRDASDTHVFGVSWGPANANSIPQPKVHFTGSSTSNTSTYFKEDTVPELTDPANWQQNSATHTRGTGNTTANSNWINLLRARVEGSGTVSIRPTEIDGSTDTSVTIVYRRDPAFTVTALRVIIPPDFSWSRSLSSVSYSNITAMASISGDTILFTNISFAVDSTEITIDSITTAVFTGYYRFKVQSGTASSFGDVAPTPVVTVYGAAIPIADTKVNDANGVALRLGELVTVRGIITVGNEFGSPSFIQDNSAGMSVFGSIFSSAVNIGDEVAVTGRVTQFNGLNQIELPVRYSVISTGNMVEPLLVTPTQLKNDGVGGVENYEGLLVRLNGVTVTELNGNPVASWVANTNYRLIGSSPSDTVQMRIDNNTNLVGAAAPVGQFEVIGVLGQYKTSAPYVGGYQVMPRSTADIFTQGPIISEFPRESNLAPTSMTITFKTVNPGTTRLRYGTTRAYELGVVEPDNVLRTVHIVNLSGLTPATIYQVQAFSVSGTDTSFAGNLTVSTSSPPNSTGQINVYFNKSVNTALARGENAQGNVNLVEKLVRRINNARRSIDAALYSLSGTPGPGSDIAEALVAAKDRGVKVRMIGEYDNRNTSPWSTLTSSGIPVVYDFYGSNDGTGLHHNKFFIFDYRGGAPESVWVWTGSWNPTIPGTYNDRQNAIEIQDVALAGAFTAEFEEMWGSSTQTPNAANSRFGARKTDNTPHRFLIGGSEVLVYFSPGDRTRLHIASVLGRAQNSVNTSVMAFTRRDLADTLINLHRRNRRVRVLMDDTIYTGHQFYNLRSGNVDVLLKGFSGALLHHKYAIVDAEPGGNPAWVITGSYNWTSSAENSNDENTVIIQSDRVANLYLQEFSARYTDAGGLNPIVLEVREISDYVPEQFSLSQNYPNPFNPNTKIRFTISDSRFTTLKVYDVLGQEVVTLVNEVKQPGTYEVEWNADGLANGVYFYKITAGDFTDVKKLILLK